MKRLILIGLVLFALCAMLPVSAAPGALALDVPQCLQDQSVTILANGYQGSGVFVQTKDGQVWVLTCGHLVVHAKRTTPMIISGDVKFTSDFDDLEVIQDEREDGAQVGQTKRFAEVIRYSNSESGHDLALLRLRSKKFKPAASAKFYLDEKLPKVGSPLLHCGSLYGEFGSNSVTDGIVSQLGRLMVTKVFDQTSCTALPGSSGGIVALKSDGRYVGMLVRGATDTFNFIVPIRRIRAWAKAAKVEFILDPALPVPTETELRKSDIEDRTADGVMTSGGRSYDPPEGTSFRLYQLPAAKPAAIPLLDRIFLWNRFTR